MRLKLPRPSRRATIILLILLTFFIALRNISFLEPVKMFVVSIFAPAQAQLFKLGGKVSTFLGDVSEKRNLAKRNRELEETVKELQDLLASETDRRRSREEELRSLKAFLREHDDETIEGVQAHVIGWGSASWRSSIVIDRGSTHGVEKHQPVVWHDHVVGMVAEAWGTTSRVKLITDPQCRIMGRSIRSGEKCIVEGTADGRCRLKYVFDSVDIRPGDLIVTTGEHGIFPKHVNIGTVLSSEGGEVGLFRNVVVQPRMLPSKLEAVLVVERLSARAQKKTTKRKR